MIDYIIIGSSVFGFILLCLIFIRYYIICKNCRSLHHTNAKFTDLICKNCNHTNHIKYCTFEKKSAPKLLIIGAEDYIISREYRNNEIIENKGIRNIYKYQPPVIEYICNCNDSNLICEKCQCRKCKKQEYEILS